MFKRYTPNCYILESNVACFLDINTGISANTTVAAIKNKTKPTQPTVAINEIVDRGMALIN